MQCPDCGQTNHPTWYFCASCGQSLDTVRITSQRAASAMPPTSQPPVMPSLPQHQPLARPQPAAPTQSPLPALFQPALQPAYGQAAPAPYQINVYVQNHMVPTMPAIAPAGSPALLVGAGAATPSLLVRIVWFLCIGLWLGMLTTLVSWALIISVLGLPLGVMLLNRLPKIMTLQPTRQHMRIESYSGGYAISQGGPPQHAMLVRAIYFLAIGWWLSAIWLMAAWGFAGLTFGLGLPVAFWMFNQVGAVTTLTRR